MIRILNERCRETYESRQVTITLPDFPAPERFVSLDVETATSEKDICQIGIVEVLGGEIISRHSIFVKPPGNRYDYWCVKTHGITPAKTANMPDFRSIWSQVDAILDRAIVVCHNAPFDLGAIEHCLDRDGMGDLVIQSFIDTCEELGVMDLYSCCAHFGIEIGLHHDAAADAEATARLLLAYSKQRGHTITIHKVPERKLTYTQLIRETRESLVDTDKQSIFYGKTVVISGIFEIERDELAIKLTEAGAKVTTSISSKTDYLLAGEYAGTSKLAKAKDIQASGGKIQIIGEKELREMLITTGILNEDS